MSTFSFSTFCGKRGIVLAFEEDEDKEGTVGTEEVEDVS
jgi:hypothetical protein